MTKYSKHLLKYCSKHGLENEYNNIRDEFLPIRSELERELLSIREHSNQKCEDIGKKYTSLLHEEMKLKGEELQKINEEIATLKKKQQEIDAEINNRHRYYQSITVSESDAIRSDFIALRDAKFKAIDDSFDSKLYEKFGDV